MALRIVGKLVNRVTSVPDLVGIAGTACPNLENVAVGNRAVGEVSTFAMVGPSEIVIGGVVPFLVLVLASGVTVVDLQFCTVCIDTVPEIDQ